MNIQINSEFYFIRAVYTLYKWIADLKYRIFSAIYIQI